MTHRLRVLLPEFLFNSWHQNCFFFMSVTQFMESLCCYLHGAFFIPNRTKPMILILTIFPIFGQPVPPQPQNPLLSWGSLCLSTECFENQVISNSSLFSPLALNKSSLNLCWIQNFKWLSNITIAIVTTYVVIPLLNANRNGCGSPFTKTDPMVFFPMWMCLPNVTLPQLPLKGGFCDLFEYAECSRSNIMKLLRLKRTWEDPLSLSILFNHQVNKSSEQVMLDDERHVT